MYMFSILVLLILQSQCADWTISPYKETGNFDPSKKILMVATQNLVPTTGYSFTWWVSRELT